MMATPRERSNLRPVAPPIADRREIRDVRARRPAILTRTLLASSAWRALSAAILYSIDVVGIALAVYIALAIKDAYLGKYPIQWGILWQAEARWLPFLALVTLLVFWRAGLYGSRETRPGFPRVLSSLAIVVVVTLAFAIATGQSVTTGSTFVVGFVLASIFIGLLRWSYESVTRDVLGAVGATRRTVLIGSTSRIESLRRSLERGEPDIRYDFVDELESVSELDLALLRNDVDEILVEGNIDDVELTDLLDAAHRHGVTVRVAPTTAELLTHRADYVPGRAVPLFELRPPVFAGTDWLLKRGFDLLVSALIVFVGLPLWLAIAAAIRLTSSGPIFYRDPRIGVGERPFQMLKFRTMYVDAASLQPELEQLNEADGALFKIRRDPRVTPVGRMLRRLSLDEMPNVWNVLKGQMSLVGPRPLPIRDYGLLQPWHRKRYLVLPGVTGLWQISGRSELGFDDLVRLDFFYLENWSIWLDISILVRTVPAVFRRKGAY
jgi:exopolysaccharide biosynthesis polyprenyl glycosylphosphotransferase